MTRTCSDCPTELGSKNLSGRCKPCSTRKNNADPVLAEKRRQGIQRRFQDPEYRARHAARCADQNRNISDEVREQRRQHGYRMVDKLAEASRAVTPEMRAENGRKRSATVLAWCPPEWRAKYLELTKRGRRAPVAKRIVLNLIRGIPEPIPYNKQRSTLAWCPPEWRAKYLELTKRGRRAPVAKRIVLNLIRGIPEPIPYNKQRSTLAWCPPARRAEYERARQQVGAPEARRIIEADLTPFERQMARIAAGAQLVAVPDFRTGGPEYTLGGISSGMI